MSGTLTRRGETGATTLTASRANVLYAQTYARTLPDYKAIKAYNREISRVARALRSLNPIIPIVLTEALVMPSVTVQRHGFTHKVALKIDNSPFDEAEQPSGGLLLLEENGHYFEACEMATGFSVSNTQGVPHLSAIEATSEDKAVLIADAINDDIAENGSIDATLLAPKLALTIVRPRYVS